MSREPTRDPTLLTAAAPVAKSCPLGKTTRRIGLAVFLIFLAKGLAWLVVPALLLLFR